VSHLYIESTDEPSSIPVPPSPLRCFLSLSYGKTLSPSTTRFRSPELVHGGQIAKEKKQRSSRRSLPGSLFRRLRSGDRRRDSRRRNTATMTHRTQFDLFLRCYLNTVSLGSEGGSCDGPPDTSGFS